MLVPQLVRAFRSLARAPAFAIPFIVLLAVGAGAAGTAQGLLTSLVFQPLPFAEQDRLVRIRESRLPNFAGFGVATGKYLEWQHDATGLASMAMFRQTTPTLTSAAFPKRLTGIQTTSAFFQTLGAPMALGNGFDPNAVDADRELAIISHRAWQRHFNARPDIIGAAVTLDGRSHDIVGVLAPGLDYPSPMIEVYTLWRPGAAEARNFAGNRAGVIARMNPGVGIETVLSELSTIQRRIEQTRGLSRWDVEATPLMDDILGNTPQRVYLMTGVLTLLLLIAISNLSALALIRSSGRAQDFAIQRALGASRMDIFRVLSFESAVLGSIGGLLGALLAFVGVSSIRAAAPQGLARVDALAFGVDTLAFCLAAGLLIAALAAALAAAVAGKRGIREALMSGGRGTASAGASRLRNVLVVGKVALAFVLMAAASLLVQSNRNLAAVDPGFRSESGLYAEIALPETKYADAAQVATLYRQLIDDVAALPGVERASVVQSLPMVRAYSLAVDIADGPALPDGEIASGQYYVGSPDYLGIMGIELLRGRVFSTADRAESLPVTVVSEAFEKRYFPRGSALGQRIRLVNEPDWREIVGVVADVRQRGLDAEPTPQMYAPFEQQPFSRVFLVLDSTVPPSGLAGPIKAALARLDGDLAVGDLQPVSGITEISLASGRFLAQLVSIFSALAVALTFAGLYGTLLYSVEQRRREFGVRRALGARHGVILGGVLRQGAALALIGSVLGIVGVLLLDSTLDAFVFSTDASNPANLMAVGAAVLVVSLLAALLPGVRAMRMSPTEAIRYG